MGETVSFRKAGKDPSRIGWVLPSCVFDGVFGEVDGESACSQIAFVLGEKWLAEPVLVKVS